MSAGKRETPEKGKCFFCGSKKEDDRGWLIHKKTCIYVASPIEDTITKHYTRKEFEDIQKHLIKKEREDNA